MPSDQFVPVTVPLYYEGHAYRAGSRIRVRISAPNGDQPIWSFSETEPAGTAEVEIGYGDGMPSRLVLPQVPGVDRAGSASAVPGPARRAVSRLRAVHEPHCGSVSGRAAVVTAGSRTGSGSLNATASWPPARSEYWSPTLARMR